MSREMNDPLAEFDRQLRAELSITPSPEFEARVRQRIDDRPARRWAWMPSYAWLTAAAAIFVVAGAVVLLNRNPVPPEQPEVPAPARALAPVVSPASPEREVASAAPDAPRHAQPVRVPAAIRAPEVLVPPQQAEAIRRLVRQGIEVPAEPVQTIAGVPEPLEVQPLVVDPIPVPPTAPSGGGISPVERGR